jgi:hypothetical protein
MQLSIHMSNKNKKYNGQYLVEQITAWATATIFIGAVVTTLINLN